MMESKNEQSCEELLKTDKPPDDELQQKQITGKYPGVIWMEKRKRTSCGLGLDPNPSCFPLCEFYRVSFCWSKNGNRSSFAWWHVEKELSCFSTMSSVKVDYCTWLFGMSCRPAGPTGAVESHQTNTRDPDKSTCLRCWFFKCTNLSIDVWLWEVCCIFSAAHQD